MELTVGMGEIQVASCPHILRAVAMGSCIAVALYDRDTRTGGLAHVVLPYIEGVDDKSQPTRFADIAIATMIDEMKRRGVQNQHLKAKIFGGANMFPEIITSDSVMDVGKRNTLAVREVLKRHNIAIIAEEVGDHIGRTVILDTRDGSAEVKCAHLGKRKY